jgi:hypothetical protein
LLVAMTSALIVFTAAFSIPLANSILTVYNEFMSGGFMSTPSISFTLLFFLFLEITFLAVLISVTYMIVQNYRSTPKSQFES